MNKKITIIGFFAFNTEYNGGQENKTRALADLLSNKLGKDNIYTVDTLGWKKRPLRLFIKTFTTIRKSNAVIMLPAENGVKIFSELLLLFRKKNTKLFYSVVGGWLPELTKRNKKLRNNLSKFDGIWVETKSMQNSLIKQNLKNVITVPNFKNIQPISSKELKTEYKKPFKICTFSRVLKEKGIEDAIEVIKKVNEKYNETIYELDIYGRIDTEYKTEFDEVMKDTPEYIQYKGVVPYNDTVNTLKDYFLLLFPTHYKTEGIPGTIIDGYASGVPVVSAKWNSYDDVIIDNITGLGFKQNDNEDLEKELIKIIEKPEIIVNMKKECLKEFKKYTEDYMYSLIEEKI